MKKVIIFVIAIGLILFGYMYYMKNADRSVEALSKYGSSGEEVRQIQQKLKNWGYYSGNVDGVYGTKTQTAVKKFQKANKLKEDGIAGEKTLSAMGISSSGGSSGSSSSSNSGTANSSDLNLLSRLVYGEARGEQYIRTSCSCSGCFK